jgi:hypothetical protein
MFWISWVGTLMNTTWLLFCHVLTSSFFCLSGQFHEQTNGVAKESLLSPLIVIFFLEDFEEEALKLATHKPLCWFTYVHVTMFWPHGQENLGDFYCHLKSIASTITVHHGGWDRWPHPLSGYHHLEETWRFLRHRVYRKLAHTNLN